MFKTTETPQGGRVALAGKSVVDLASKNHSGSTVAPEPSTAAKRAFDECGGGPCAGRDIVGDFPAHAGFGPGFAIGAFVNVGCDSGVLR